MHFSRINTSIVLDLSSPLSALAFSRVLLSLEACISDIRETVKRVWTMVVDETHLQSAVSWRTDRCVYSEYVSNNRDTHDMISRWIEGQQYITAGVCVLGHPHYYLTLTLRQRDGPTSQDKSVRLTALCLSSRSLIIVFCRHTAGGQPRAAQGAADSREPYV